MNGPGVPYHNNRNEGQLKGPGTYPGGQPTVVVRLIFSRDEAGFLFGFDGVLVAQLSQQTGAEIHMNNGECADYVVHFSGTLDMIYQAFSLVFRKVWEFWTNVIGANDRPLTVRLAVAGNQCGSIIGRHGSKINEIRDLTGANITVSQETLPNSTERPVEIVGNGENCLQCALQICKVLQENPPKPDTIPYVPVPWDDGMQHNSGEGDAGVPDINMKPVFLCGDRAYIIDGNVARLAPPEMLRKELSKSTLGGHVAEIMTQGLTPNKHTPEHMNPLALIAAISNSHRSNGQRTQTSREMWVSAELMVGVLRKNHGAILEEIQRMSGAQVHIASEDEITASGEVLVTVSGTEDSVLLAQFLVQSNLDLASKEMRGAGPPFDNMNQMGFVGPPAPPMPGWLPGQGNGTVPPPNNFANRGGIYPNSRGGHENGRGGGYGGDHRPEFGANYPPPTDRRGFHGPPPGSFPPDQGPGHEQNNFRGGPRGRGPMRGNLRGRGGRPLGA